MKNEHQIKSPNYDKSTPRTVNFLIFLDIFADYPLWKVMFPIKRFRYGKGHTPK